MIKLKEILSEAISLPIEIGDTVLMGKFKNKKVVVKDISWNEKGDLLINGKSALRIRLQKQDVNEYLKKKGNKWVVLSKKGKLLGTHDTKEKAMKQLAAIEANK